MGNGTVSLPGCPLGAVCMQGGRWKGHNQNNGQARAEAPTGRSPQHIWVTGIPRITKGN